MKLKALSLNIACFIPWDDKKTLLENLVKQEKPDVLCLQEVAQNLLEDTKEYNQIQKIAGLFDTKQYHGNLCNPYIVTEEHRKNDSCYHGCATYILNPKIDLASSVDLAMDESNDRFAIQSELKFSGKKVKIINLHLDANVRHEEAKHLTKKLSLESGRLILCGDLNSFEAVSGDGDVDSKFRLVLTDVWEELNGNRAVTSFGAEWWYKNFPEHPHTIKIKSRNRSYPDGNLDYIFCKNITPINIKTLSKTVPHLSDHAALAAEFEI